MLIDFRELVDLFLSLISLLGSFKDQIWRSLDGKKQEKMVKKLENEAAGQIWKMSEKNLEFQNCSLVPVS